MTQESPINPPTPVTPRKLKGKSVESRLTDLEGQVKCGHWLLAELLDFIQTSLEEAITQQMSAQAQAQLNANLSQQVKAKMAGGLGGLKNVM